MHRFARNGLAIGSLALALPLLAACADKPAPTVSVPVAPPALAASDATFVQTAAQGSMTEIQAGQLAQTKAKSPKVKTFATQMVTDHTANFDQLKQVVANKGVTLPTDVSDQQKTALTQLQGETGRAFDKDYVADMVAGHEAMLEAFQSEAQTGTDADLKKYASDTIPAIQQHLAEAKKLQGPPMGKHYGHHHHAK